jgi:glycosyltransferase involved in cell wall biosynthesis
MRLLMLSGDEFIARKQKNVFYDMLREYSHYWDTIDIITPGGLSREPFTIHDTVTVFPSMKHKFFHTQYIYTKGLALLGDKKHDLITAHDYPPFQMGIGGWLLGRKMGIPYVLEFLHVVGYPKAPNFKEHLSREMTKLYLRYMWKSASAIRVVNHVEVPELLKRLGIPESHIIVTPCFYLDFEVFKPMELPKTGKKVIFTGRLVPNKGIIELIQAFRLVVDVVADAELMIVGDGILKEKLVNLTRELGIADRVEFKGMVPHEDIATCNNQCDIFVFPSYNEGAPRSVGEAMACGLPLITTNIGIMKEIIRNGENGLFITWEPKDIAEKILLLLQNKDLREKIAANGRQTVQQFEYKKMIRDYALRYHELINRLGKTT